MSNLASSYFDLGRHEDALAMRERALEFRRRVLPENHPDIGEGRVRSGVACGVLSGEGIGFAYCDVQARPWATLPFHTPISGGTRKRLR